MSQRFWPRAKSFCLVGAVVIGLGGCVSTSPELVYDRYHPLLHVTAQGLVFEHRTALETDFSGPIPEKRYDVKREYVTPEQAVDRLKEYKIPTENALYVLIEPSYQEENASDRRLLWVLQKNVLNRAGYRHVIFVRETETEAVAVDSLECDKKPKLEERKSGGKVPRQSSKRVRAY